MKAGDVLQIDGRLGFAMNPKIEVVKISGGLVTITTLPRRPGGLLSETNTSVIAMDIFKTKIK